MALSHQISQEHQLARVIGEGEVLDQDVVVAIRNLLDDPLFKPGFDVFIDLRNLENFGVTTAGMREIALVIQEDDRVLSSARIAVVVSNIFNLGMIKMLQSLTARKLPWQIVTMDYDESLRYLKLNAPLDAIFS